MSAVSLSTLYGADYIKQQVRYRNAITAFADVFGGAEADCAFSAPGRTELCGNHTDHNCGKALAAAVNVDIIAVVKKTDDEIITIKSNDFPTDTINLTDLINLSDLIGKSANCERHFGQSSEIIKGIAAGFLNAGYKIGGFCAYTHSTIPKGSGLSSSAAYEVLIGTILSHLYNDDTLTPLEIAKIGQYAESEWYGKPCGLLDQIASAMGGCLRLDFYDPSNPSAEQVEFDPKAAGYTLCITDTKGSHADLTADYADIPREMKSVAEMLNVPFLTETSKAVVISQAAHVRKMCGDRAFLRAMHFFDENDRVDSAEAAIRRGDYTAYFNIIRQSGESSYKLLQNIYSPSRPDIQGLSVGLYLTEQFLGEMGVCRVHGGGFAGAIQSYIPTDMTESYRLYIDTVFGLGCCYRLNVRNYGGVKIQMT
jgi:galactokinase